MGFGLMIGFIGLFDTLGGYPLQVTVVHMRSAHTHTRARMHIHGHFFSSHCLLAASPSSGFSNCRHHPAVSFSQQYLTVT
jgi:hypothetical protein